MFRQETFQVCSCNSAAFIVAAGIANENARGSEPLFLSKISNANSANDSSSDKIKRQEERRLVFSLAACFHHVY